MNGDAAPLVVANGSMWEQLEPLPARQDTVYGRELTWRVNTPELAALVTDSLIARWRSLDIPLVGPPVSASAFLVPARYMPGCVEGGPPDDRSPFTDIVHPNVGYQLVSAAGFGSCSWNRRAATACISDAADLPYMVEHLVQHVWSAAVMWHPPLYGLHAAGVVGHDGSVSLLVGESGVGKSSLVACLAFRHGFGYLTDDLTVLDGRSLRVYGRPWRLELRAGALQELWPDGPPEGRRLGEKTVLDARRHVPVAVGGPVANVFFVQRGETTEAAPMAPDAVRTRLGTPVSMFVGSADVARGHEKAFDRLARSVRGYELSVDHRAGVERAVEAVRDILG